MKSFKALIFFFVAIFATYNLFLSSQTVNENFLSLRKLQAFAYDLPEVTITCDSGGSGRCWDEDCHWEWTPLGGWFMTYCTGFTGYEADICVPGIPC